MREDINIFQVSESFIHITRLLMYFSTLYFEFNSEHDQKQKEGNAAP
jgi:hypothetical protein